MGNRANVAKQTTRDEGASRSQGRRGRRRARPGLVLGLWLLAVVAAPALPAQEVASPHEIIWAHANPAVVARFVVYVSGARGDVSGARQVDLGKPAGEPSGSVQIFSAIVPMRASDFIALAAVGWDGRMSTLSSWSAVPPSRPGQPIVIQP